ncbi:unnamed protein product [Fraxinus pennsylvanica]|uniref:DUF629 domain-containing protein n=1 Tax=Fraxinus pennsylvanica TaxID=56036 RepID=A0AAD2AE27_9LAMI|nr:unnamed protein product [Fraxinus pennsylvanica]
MIEAKSAPKGEFRILENWPTIEERKSEVEITVSEFNGVLQPMCIESSLPRVGSNEIKSGQSLFQQKNIVSISSRMKNMGNEENKLLTRVLEDPIELEQTQGIKMTFNTTKERRKEIELSVTAAQLLQQKAEYLQVGEVRISPGTLKKHLGILLPKFQLVIPDRVENECIEILLSCSWKPMDPNAAITMLEERSKQWDSSIVGSEIKNTGDGVLFALRRHSSRAQHLKRSTKNSFAGNRESGFIRENVKLKTRWMKKRMSYQGFMRHMSPCTSLIQEW